MSKRMNKIQVVRIYSSAKSVNRTSALAAELLLSVHTHALKKSHVTVGKKIDVPPRKEL